MSSKNKRADFYYFYSRSEQEKKMLKTEIKGYFTHI